LFKIKIVILVVCLILWGGTLAMAASASNLSRDEIITRQLECVANNYDSKQLVRWEDVCYTQQRGFSKDVAVTETGSFEIAKVPEVRVRTRSLEPSRFDMAQAEPSRAQVTLDEAGNVSIGGNIVKTEESADTPEDEDGAEEPEEDLGPMSTEEAPGEEQITEEPLAEAEPVKEKGSFWKLDPLFQPDNPLTDIEFGTEVFSYEYREDEAMNLEGYMYGIYGAFTYRTALNERIHSLKDVFSDTNSINMFKLEGRFSYGLLDYASYGTGEDEDIPNWSAEVRGLVGYDIPFMAQSRVTPYLGIGYRYLLDDQGPGTTTTGNWLYDRESHYVYLPLGLEAQFPIKGSWSWGFSAEYDLLIDGEQTSHLEDGGTGLDTLDNDQNDGYGVRGAVRLMKTTQYFDMYLEPFVRYWRIDNSEDSVITSGGVPVSDDGDSVYVGWEPKNDTTELGIKMGLKF
jgi:hypothetical protein